MESKRALLPPSCGRGTDGSATGSHRGSPRMARESLPRTMRPGQRIYRWCMWHCCTQAAISAKVFPICSRGLPVPEKHLIPLIIQRASGSR